MYNGDASACCGLALRKTVRGRRREGGKRVFPYLDQRYHFDDVGTEITEIWAHVDQRGLSNQVEDEYAR